MRRAARTCVILLLVGCGLAASHAAQVRVPEIRWVCYVMSMPSYTALSTLMRRWSILVDVQS